ncbi:MAG: phosphopantothenate/pantothenate synthetase [Desulfurococcales archaeon]|nr:phosphopantothenate/pantothenate synthetase [Desulfurococcales archaeon]
MAGHEIPRSHPRYHSLVVRERLVEGFRKGIVVPQGLIAHGRGEAFDYILGERTHDFAEEAIRAAVAWLLLARHPVISVNGNLAALAPREVGELARLTGALVEVNLFYRTEERVRAIEDHLKANGVGGVLGSACRKRRLPGLESPRGIVCEEGIFRADFVLVAIEDGDRTEALRRAGKRVAAIDLNPFSRTAQMADITIVDEATRALRRAVEVAKELRGAGREELEGIVSSYDNAGVLARAFQAMLARLSEAASKGRLLEPPA